MHIFSKLMGIIAIFPIVSLAAPSRDSKAELVERDSAFSKCYTSLGSTTPATRITTKWQTFTRPCTATFTKFTSTITTPTIIITSCQTSTQTVAGPASTDTAFTTTTVHTASTTTLVATTVIVTVSSDLSTVSTVNGAAATFLPVQDTLSGSTEVKKRSLDQVEPLEKRAIPKAIPKAPGKIPNAVRCNLYTAKCTPTTSTKTITSTASIHTTTISPICSTATVTSIPKASTTSTITAVVTDTVTSIPDPVTSMTTIINTVYTSTTTTYPCSTGTNNLADQSSGLGFYGVFQNDGGFSGTVFTTDTTPNDCCVSAFLDPQAAIFLFYAPGSYCYLAESNTCGAGNTQNAEYGVGLSGSSDITWIVGNTNCGKVDFFQ